jgi:hypothetical protein
MLFRSAPTVSGGQVVTIDTDVLNAPPTPYGQARELIQNGDIALFHGNEPFSRLIETFTNGPFSHVGFVWRMDEIDRVMLLECVDQLGVRLIPLSTKLNGNGTDANKPYTGQLVIARHRDFPIGIADAEHADNQKFRDMTKFAVDRVGCPYSAHDIAGIAARIVVGFAGVTDDKTLAPDGSYICSEYAWECYRQIGIEIPFSAEKFIAPNDFARDPKIEFIAHVIPDSQ